MNLSTRAKCFLKHKYPSAVAVYRGIRNLKYLFAIPSATAFGFKFAGDTRMTSCIYEPELTMLLQGLLPYNDYFINIGANIGTIAALPLMLVFAHLRLSLPLLIYNIYTLIYVQTTGMTI